MSQYFELKELFENDDRCRSNVVEFYSNVVDFPITLREYFAEWIENESNWQNQAPMADDVLRSLEFLLPKNDMGYLQAYQKIKHKYPTNEAFSNVIQRILDWEKSYLCEYSEGLFPDMKEMKSMMEEVLHELRACGHEGNADLSSLLQDLYEIWDKLQNALGLWQRHQQVQFITEEHLYSLDLFQQAFEQLVTVINGCLKHRSQSESQKEAKNLLEHVIQRSFIIEKQYPQNLKNITSSKKGIKYSLLVRFLAGNAVLATTTQPEITINFHCERNLQHPTSQAHRHANVLIDEKPNKVHMLPNEHGWWCSDLQDRLKIIGFKRCDEKKAIEDVSERKYGLKVESEVYVTALKRKVKLEAVTLPLIITTQTSQDCSAAATLLWDCAFAEPGRRCYDVPERVPWSKLALVLSKRFSATTGKGLTSDQKRCLAKKLCANKKLQHYGKEEISWKSFNKMRMYRDFTFWRWFYAVNNLVKRHLKKPWQEGLIHGFIDKTDVREKLRQNGVKSGTFILRFSEKNIEETQSTHFGGGLCVAYVEHINGVSEIEFVYPFMASEFETTPFCKYLKTLELEDSQYPTIPKKSPLNYLYPDRPFEETFASCMKEEMENAPPEQEHEADDEESYRRPMRKLFIPHRVQSNPTSPAYYGQEVPSDEALIDMLTAASFMPTTSTPTVSMAGVTEQPITDTTTMESSSDSITRMIMASLGTDNDFFIADSENVSSAMEVEVSSSGETLNLDVP